MNQASEPITTPQIKKNGFIPGIGSLIVAIIAVAITIVGALIGCTWRVATRLATIEMKIDLKMESDKSLNNWKGEVDRKLSHFDSNAKLQDQFNKGLKALIES